MGLHRNLVLAFTLVELMTVIVIVGILSAVGMVSYNKYTIKAKMAEAHVGIDVMSKNLVSFYIQNKTFAFLTGNPVVIPGRTKLPVTSMAGTNWTLVGYPFVPDTQVQFSYAACGGQTNAAGVDFSTVIASCVPGTQFHGITQAAAQACIPFVMNTVVNTAGKSQYSWAVVLASANFVEDSGAAATCTRFYKLVDTGDRSKVNASGPIGSISVGE